MPPPAGRAELAVRLREWDGDVDGHPHPETLNPKLENPKAGNRTPKPDTLTPNTGVRASSLMDGGRSGIGGGAQPDRGTLYTPNPKPQFRKPPTRNRNPKHETQNLEP